MEEDKGSVRRVPEMVLSSLLEKNAGNLSKVLSVEDKLMNLGCTEIGRKTAKAEMDLTKANNIGVYTGFGSRLKRNIFRGSWMPRGDALKKLEEKSVVIRFVIVQIEVIAWTVILMMKITGQRIFFILNV